MLSFKKLYLVAYNAIEVIGWSLVFYILVSHYGDNTSTLSLWDKIWLPLTVIQYSAYLEIIHSMIGLVKSNLYVTFAQVSSRLVLILVLFSLPWDFVGSSLCLPYTVLSWSITEILRYLYYLLNILSFVPKFLTWLRYSTFLVLYPTGISGELWCIYYAIVYSMSHPELWSYALPNPWNFTFSYLYFLISLVLLYIPGSFILYFHMLSQRKKILGTKVAVKKVK
ncbi:PREDICTED: very-long-chain (3R)-3-hydroxyacyl-CoA dehydratase hpo-8 [Polistes canadensis]|uniref:very-long-chain (3R)-3-hydroxyacyl-CoA dehydratase hpo-8 n=1 Tax=Polistes canadensis TaxID=91411 RepID=UPI000718BC1A|nr:PREDICTED: very-long-chain (3R)-3-hydroxyacyl-CoA dehydratase hpo-8 [Polistes canadensis]